MLLRLAMAHILSWWRVGLVSENVYYNNVLHAIVLFVADAGGGLSLIIPVIIVLILVVLLLMVVLVSLVALKILKRKYNYRKLF